MYKFRLHLILLALCCKTATSFGEKKFVLCPAAAAAGNICPRSPGSDMFRSTNNIKVYVRIRPLSKDEYARGETSCVHIARDEHSVKVSKRRHQLNMYNQSLTK
jgi:hypothetical protein